MIRRNRSAVTITCDTCGQFRQDTHWRPNKAAWDEAQALGWVARKAGNDWTHHCPDCKERGGSSQTAVGT